MSLEDATLFVDTIETIVDLVDDPDTVETETRDSKNRSAGSFATYGGPSVVDIEWVRSR